MYPCHPLCRGHESKHAPSYTLTLITFSACYLIVVVFIYLRRADISSMSDLIRLVLLAFQRVRILITINILILSLCDTLCHEMFLHVKMSLLHGHFIRPTNFIGNRKAIKNRCRNQR